jgi:hypothetical protein
LRLPVPSPQKNKKTKSPSLLRKLTPLVVAFTHRRILDYAGGIQSSAYSNVIANAERCGGLVQLGPLDSEEREDYLRQTLKVSSLPVEVYKWVSDVANGNPQYIEICAKEVCFKLLSTNPAISLSLSPPSSSLKGLLK